MRLILSRKGFDSSAGGVASPIFPAEQSRVGCAKRPICSLPIPVSLADGLKFKEVRYPTGRSIAQLAPLVKDLTNGNVTESDYVHLDPDLRRTSLPIRKRMNGWLPSFGQSEAAAGHLLNQGVDVGDLFIFFGWFRSVEYSSASKKWQFCSEEPDLHLIYGWLQVGQIFRDPKKSQLPKWLQSHPHACGHSANARNNVIYVAKDKLDIDGLTECRGGGVFDNFSQTRVLTAKNANGRSIWNLPSWFASEPRLSYHGNPDRWKIERENCQLQTVGRGQEFVIDCKTKPEAIAWIKSLFA